MPDSHILEYVNPLTYRIQFTGQPALDALKSLHDHNLDRDLVGIYSRDRRWVIVGIEERFGCCDPYLAITVYGPLKPTLPNDCLVPPTIHDFLGSGMPTDQPQSEPQLVPRRDLPDHAPEFRPITPAEQEQFSEYMRVASAQLEAEARIVAWLRKIGDWEDPEMDPHVCRGLADMIDRGEHYLP